MPEYGVAAFVQRGKTDACALQSTPRIPGGLTGHQLPGSGAPALAVAKGCNVCKDAIAAGQRGDEAEASIVLPFDDPSPLAHLQL